MQSGKDKPKIAVHKFASCDGCQLAFLNAGEDLLTLASMVNIVHFPEAGPVDNETPVDIAFVEGSITTPADRDRIKRVRDSSRYLITIGACATAGGIQALRNFASADEWVSSVYATPEYIQTLATSSPIRKHVHVDLELWGCPVNTRQVLTAVRNLLSGVTPTQQADKVCMDCKRQHTVCVMVAGNMPCMGPVTRTGCGSICPHVGRGCYGCYGPAENVNTQSLGRRFEGLGLVPEEVAKRFLFINSEAPEFHDAGEYWKSR
ncbi:MAG: sulfhydrogenase subunit delta [Gammaproteobacteria bacterium]|jgi:coenzyme F420-reducing hydrogenase gamma subunit